jgi:hypothetical protein
VSKLNHLVILPGIVLNSSLAYLRNVEEAVEEVRRPI